MFSWKLKAGVAVGVLVAGGLLFVAGYLFGVRNTPRSPVEVVAGPEGGAIAVPGDTGEAEKQADTAVRALGRQKDAVQTAESYVSKVPGLEGAAAGLGAVSKGLGGAKSVARRSKDVATTANVHAGALPKDGGAAAGGPDAAAEGDLAAAASAGEPAAGGEKPAAAGGEEAKKKAAEPAARPAVPAPLAPMTATSSHARPAPPPDMPAAPPGPEGAEAAAPAPAGVLFSVQVGYFATEAKAKDLKGELAGKGYTTDVFAYADEAGRTWYSVGVGDFDRRDRAERAARDFTRSEGKAARVVFLSAAGPGTAAPSGPASAASGG